jgi:myo-inositol 2-dehydrogenase/D-chiro-inositol 1-dehydrogenase
VRRLRIGCVGTGWIAQRHLGALSQLPDVGVVAVADPLAERAKEAAERFGARAYDDGLALLAAEELEAVWLCVPPFAHGPLETAALERDLPFFVEKPLALDFTTALAIGQGVRERNLLTAVGYHWRHLDLIDRAAALLRETPAQLVTGFWLASRPPWPWWSLRGRSGGQVLEQTTHVFDLARRLVGEVDAVDAVELAPSTDTEVPTAASATLRFASGAIGTVASACVLGWRHRVGLHLVAENRVIEFAEHGLCQHELRVFGNDGTDVATSDEDPIAREDREFVAALRGQIQRSRVPYEEALRTHALAWAADRAARENVQVRPPAVMADV